MEWAYAKLVGADIDEGTASIVLQVTNRQASHVLNVDNFGPFAMKVDAALAQFQGRPPAVMTPPEPPPGLEAGPSALPPPPPPTGR